MFIIIELIKAIIAICIVIPLLGLIAYLVDIVQIKY
jgi:hypothetical protein